MKLSHFLCLYMGLSYSLIWCSFTYVVYFAKDLRFVRYWIVLFNCFVLMNKGWVWKLEFLMHLLQWGDPLVLQLHDPFPLVLLVGSGLFWPGSFCNLAFLCGVCSSAGQSAPEFPSDGGASLTLTNETFVTQCTVWLCILTCARVACWSCGHHAVGFVHGGCMNRDWL